MSTKAARHKVNRWLEKEGWPTVRLCRAIEDPSQQTQRWLSGDRPSLPLRFKVRIHKLTGIPLDELVTSDEAALIRALVEVSNNSRPAA